MHTLLTRPEHAELAMTFYRDRQQEAVTRHRAFSADFQALRNRPQPSPFRASRTGAPTPRVRPASEVPALNPDQPLRLADAARIVSVPVIDADRVVPGLALSHPGLERPVAFLGGVALAPLLQRMPEGLTAAQIVEHWSRRAARRQGRDILHWLWTRGIVVPVNATDSVQSISLSPVGRASP